MEFFKSAFRSYLSISLIIFGLTIKTNVTNVPSVQDYTNLGSSLYDQVATIDTVEAAKPVDIESNYKSEQPAARPAASTATAHPATRPATPAPAHTTSSNTGSGTNLANSITVAGRTISTFDTTNLGVDAGSRVAHYTTSNKFYFGHNTSNVFGGLSKLSVGSTFTITTNGQKVTYRVANKQIFDKVNGKLTQNGTGNYMYSVSKANYKGTSYDVSLMTCAGQMLGGGDATQRLVIYANRI